jgi:hypothetical protein
MQKRAGLLFLSSKSGRIFLVLEDSKWTIPTFVRNTNLLEDSKPLIDSVYLGTSKLLPIELYLSEDKGFEYGTYVCLVSAEFVPCENNTFSWATLDQLPKQLHNGLKATLNNPTIRVKLDTILELERANDQYTK